MTTGGPVTEMQPAPVGGNPPDRTYEPSGVDQLAAALAAVQEQLPRIHKGQTATVPTKAGGQYSYTYADLADVSAQIVPLLGANGLAFTTWPTINAQGKFVLRYELLHRSGQSKAGEYPLNGGNAQAIGSEITYARRYCLCAVTGVAPDDDDDAAAAVAGQAAERAEHRADQDRERQAALDAVRGAWFNQYGEWNGTAAADMFAAWSKGADVREASAKVLRAFAGYLHALPEADAGSTPETEAEPEQPTEGPKEAPTDRPMSGRQRGKVFALLGDLNITERHRQLEYLMSAIGRTIKSRGELTEADAKLAIDALQKDLDEARATGLVPAAVSSE